MNAFLDRITLRGCLSILATIGFLLCLYTLFFVPIPPNSRDVLLVLIGALVTTVKDVFGFFFGSSSGSEQKTALLAQSGTTFPPPADKREAGYVLLDLLMSVGFLLCMVVFFSGIFGCATTAPATPQANAGKALLSVKATIVSAATATDGLCRTHTIDADTCRQALAAYELAQPAYDSAVDAYLLMVQGGDSAAFAAALRQVQDLAADFARVTGGAQ